MSFESGGVSFRIFYLTETLPGNIIERFAAQAAPPIDTLGHGEIHGWVSGRHLLDRQINENTALYAGFLRMTLMSAQRKIPEALLRAECRMEELARLQAGGQDSLDRKTRTEIRRETAERLLPQMPPELKGMTLVHRRGERFLYAEAVNDKQVDAFSIGLRQAVGQGPIPADPVTVAARRRQIDVRTLTPTSFSPECHDEESGDSIGQEFLTWLWYFSEARGGLAKFGDLGQFGVVVEGPLTFVLEGSGAHEAVVRHGCPELSTEAKAALLSGKKLKRARITMARGDEQWQATVDADTFAFRGVRLPEKDKLDALSRFQERVLALDTFQGALFGFYDRFLNDRTNAAQWAKVQRDIQHWVSERAARR